MCEMMPRVRLDSSEAASPWCYAGGRAVRVLYCRPDGGGAVCRSARGVERTWDDPLEALHWMSGAFPAGRPDARWIGYLSYDLGRLFEEIPTRIAAGEDDWPLFVFSLHEGRDGDRPAARQRRVEPGSSAAALASDFSRDEYEAAVARAIEYIAAGDIFQVNLSQRFSGPLCEEPGAIYRRLRQRTPALYGACLEYGSDALICNSPELFLRVTADRRVITRPIKGTRPRGPGMDLELRRSIKDQAELNMIIDLERNDLGRVCRVGSVQVSQPRTIEAHPTVYHGVAEVAGVLREDVTFLDLLRATFPGGSITGAPKIRAMQIIETLERHRRGPYCGAIGYVCPDGSMQFNVAIRTMLVRGGKVHVPVGGGIVADSTPAGEYEETLTKARAMFAALGCGVEIAADAAAAMMESL